MVFRFMRVSKLGHGTSLAGSDMRALRVVCHFSIYDTVNSDCITIITHSLKYIR